VTTIIVFPQRQLHAEERQHERQECRGQNGVDERNSDLGENDAPERVAQIVDALDELRGERSPRLRSHCVM